MRVVGVLVAFWARSRESKYTAVVWHDYEDAYSRYLRMMRFSVRITGLVACSCLLQQFFFLQAAVPANVSRDRLDVLLIRVLDHASSRCN